MPKIKYITLGGEVLMTPSDVRLGKLLKLDASHIHYRDILNILDTADETEVLKLFETKTLDKVVVKANGGDRKIEFTNDYVFFGDYELPPSLGKKLAQLYKSGVRDFTAFDNFLKKLFSNPTKIGYSSVIDYVVTYNLNILPNGNFIAYKGVNSDGWSSHGNTETIVKKGMVDAEGRIFNAINEEVRVDRDQVDMNRDVGCSHGLHVGSYEYAKGFCSRLLTCEVDPADVCCVPHDLRCAKIRCCAYTPRDERGSNAPVQTILVQQNGETGVIENDEDEEFSTAATGSIDDKLTQRIKAYVEKKVKENGSPGYVFVRQIKGALPKFHVTPAEIIEVCNKLGFVVEPDKKHITNTKVF